MNLRVMGAQWTLELFGWLRAEQGGRAITRFRTQKTGALLAYLAYYRHRAHPREELIELLWPNCEIDAGRHSLSVALSSLRHQMEPPGVPAGAVIVADRASVQLNPAAVTTDVAEFEAAIQSAARAGSAAGQAQFLTTAVELYRGELLPGYYEDWVLAERERLADEFFQAVGRLVAHLEQAGELSRALSFAHRAIQIDPLREPSHRDLMRLSAALGQPAAALRQYRELERILGEELGVTPDAATQDLARRIAAQPCRGDAQAAAAPARHPAAEPMLPALTGSGSRAPLAADPHPLVSTLSGTVTFLVMNIEGSMTFRAQAAEAFTAALANYQALLRRQFQRHGGQVVREAGDEFWVVFTRASDATAAAVASQRALTAYQWPVELVTINQSPLRARMALHTGEVGLQEGGYFGPALERGTRLLSATHGGQVVCSEATAALLNYDLEPGLRLLDLGAYRLRGVEAPERLFQLLYPDMAQREFPPLNAEPGYRGNLPLPFTRFFGRAEELARLRQMLAANDTRLVTITGPGGTGKTRLGLEAARQLLEPLRGAVWFVPLADLSDPGLIASAVLDAMQVERAPDLEPMEQVIAVLARQPALLVLDNFERLVAGGAAIVQALLGQVAPVKCLVTSRHRLNLEGEREFPLAPLPTPAGPDTPERLILNESVRLFTDRAQAVRPDFQVTKANAAAVAELCARLEGIPLALELAAARAQVLTPSQILTRFGERLDLLVNRRRGIPPRHYTLRAAMDWSYHLLAPELRRFFARLSVFRGGWALEAAEAVCEEPLALDFLAQLRECSMIQVEEGEAEMRFHMLETLREYAAGWLAPDDRALLEQRHARHYLALAERAEPEIRGPEQAAWLNRLAVEYDNLRAALEWSKTKETGAETSLRLGCALLRFWYARGNLSEGRRHLAGALAKTSERTTLQARVLNAAGVLAYYQDDLAAARSFYEKSLILHTELGDKGSIANSLNNLAGVAGDQGDHEMARSLYEEARAIYQELGDRWGIACSLLNLGLEAYFEGDFVKARSLYEESLPMLRELGDMLGVAHLLINLGDVVRHQADLARARSLYEESLAIYRELEHKSGIADCLGNLGKVAFAEGDYAAARSLYEESLTIRIEIGSKQEIAFLLESFAALARAEGKAERSARLFGAAAALRERLGIPLPPIEQPKQEESIAALRAALGASQFAAAWKAGRALDWDKATAYALGGADAPGR